MKVLSYITAATVAAFPMQAPAQHFEIDINGNYVLPVWGGPIDLSTDDGTGSDTDSFGESEDFSFGVVREDGETTQLLLPPPSDPIIDPVDNSIENTLDSSAGILD